MSCRSGTAACSSTDYAGEMEADDPTRGNFLDWRNHFIALRQHEWDNGNFDNQRSPLKEINAQLDALSEVDSVQSENDPPPRVLDAAGQLQQQVNYNCRRLAALAALAFDDRGHLHNPPLEHEPLIISVLMCCLSCLIWVPYFARVPPSLEELQSTAADPLALALHESMFRRSLTFTIGVSAPALLAVLVLLCSYRSSCRARYLSEIAIWSGIFLLAFLIPSVVMLIWSNSNDLLIWRYQLPGFYVCTFSFQLNILGSISAGLFMRHVNDDGMSFLGKYSNRAILVLFLGRVLASIEYCQANLGDERDFYTHAYICAALLSFQAILVTYMSVVVHYMIRNKVWQQGNRALYVRGELGEDEEEVPENLIVVAWMKATLTATFVVDLAIHLVYAVTGIHMSVRAKTFSDTIVNYHIYTKLLPILVVGFVLPLWLIHKAHLRTARQLRAISKELKALSV